MSLLKLPRCSFHLNPAFFLSVVRYFATHDTACSWIPCLRCQLHPFGVEHVVVFSCVNARALVQNSSTWVVLALDPYHVRCGQFMKLIKLMDGI